MHTNKLPISIISLILLLSIFSSNNLLAKVIHLSSETQIVDTTFPNAKKNKKKLRSKKIANGKKVKGKKGRAIGMIVGGGGLILLFLIFGVLSFLSIGTSALVFYSLIGLAALIGGILLIIKGYNNLNRQSKRENSKSNNKGKATY